mgnify:CR=1 FL=1
MAKIEKGELPKEVLISGVKVPLNPNVNVADRLKKSLIADALKPKEQTATTPSPNRKISIEELQHLIDNGDVKNIQPPTHNFDALVDWVSNFVKADRVQFLVDIRQNAMGKCYKCIYSETTPEIQKVYQLIDIARVDMMIQAIIRVYGNQVLPESLQDWKPVFGLQWQMRATALITSKQSNWQSNSFWFETYENFVLKKIKESETVVKNIQDEEIEFPLKADSVKSVKIIHAEDMLVIDTGIHRHTFNWDELDAFYNKKEKKPNHLATILQDLQSDLDGCLRADGGVLYSQFGIGNSKPNTQISKLASALDNIIYIEDDRDSTSSNRWFRKSNKYSHPRWYPRFVSTKNQISKLAERTLGIGEEMDETPLEKTLGAIGQGDHPALMSQGVKPISMKKWKLQEQYQDDIDDVIVQSSRLDAKVPD